jgi:hypothetical protein
VAAITGNNLESTAKLNFTKTAEDLDFISIADNFSEKILTDFPVEIIYQVQVDNWFGAKWLGFTGKVEGALGVRHPTDLRVPPFTPSRILEQRVLKKVENGFEIIEIPQIHIEQASSDNFSRRISQFPGNTLFVWLSAKNGQNKRGSILIYLKKNEELQAWYFGLENLKSWRIVDYQGSYPRNAFEALL